MKQNVKQLSAKKAWALIAEMGWGKRTTDYKHLSETYFKLLGKEGMEKLERFVNARQSDLWSVVQSFELENTSLEVGSDDGFSDLRYHIVGMGQDEYEACMADPLKMQSRYRAREYKESFSYVFQEPDPVRTVEQKEATVAKLLAEIERSNERIAEIKNLVGLLQMQQTSISLLAAAVKNDRKSA